MHTLLSKIKQYQLVSKFFKAMLGLLAIVGLPLIIPCWILWEILKFLYILGDGICHFNLLSRPRHQIKWR